MKINLRLSSIPLMLEYLHKLKNENADKNLISDILNHPDYEYEFRRYEVEIENKNHIIDYFTNLNIVSSDEIPDFTPSRKNSLREKHSSWIAAYENPEIYELLYQNMTEYFTDRILNDICILVNNGLPETAHGIETTIISTMSIGQSFGYVFENALHFDLMGIHKHVKMEEFPTVIAHEMHHLGMMKYISEIPGFFDNMSRLERYIFTFSGEGLAIKFCNNAKGVYSKPIQSDRDENQGLDKFSMKYLNNRFHNALEVFVKTVNQLKSGEIKDEEVYQQYDNYWWNPYTEDQSHDEPPKLAQTLIYSFGNDIYGVIYDVFGLDVVFECVRRPLKTLHYFKIAAEKIGIKDLSLIEQL